MCKLVQLLSSDVCCLLLLDVYLLLSKGQRVQRAGVLGRYERGSLVLSWDRPEVAEVGLKQSPGSGILSSAHTLLSFGNRLQRQGKYSSSSSPFCSTDIFLEDPQGARRCPQHGGSRGG